MKRKIASAMCLVMMGVNFVAPIYAAQTATGTGSGSTTYVSTDHFEVVVPTSAALNFKLDPQGLLSLDTNGKKSVDSLNNSSAAGAIYGSNALVFANLGTDEVSVSANFAVTGNAVTALAHDGTVVAKPTDQNSALNIKLALVPYAAERDTDVTYKMDSTVNAGLFKATTTAFKNSEEVKGVAFDNTNSTFTFKLAAPSWNITKLAENSYTLDMDQDTNNKAVAFKIGGECNSKADWSDFIGNSPSKTVGLTATFTLDKAATGFTPDVTLDLANKTVSAATGTNLIKVPVENTAPATPTAIESSNISVSGKEITIGGFTGTASVTSVKIDDKTAEATDYAAVTTTANSLKVTLAADAGDDRNVVVAFKVGNAEYTATAKVDGLNVLESDGTADIVIFDTTLKTTDSIVVTGLTNSGAKTAITRTVSANGDQIAIAAGKTLTLKASWLATLKSSRGTGTYSVKIPGTDEAYVITLS